MDHRYCRKRLKNWPTYLGEFFFIHAVPVLELLHHYLLDVRLLSTVVYAVRPDHLGFATSSYSVQNTIN